MSAVATTVPPHVFSVDVEEYFHAFPGRVPREQWASLPSRLDQGLTPMLDALDEVGASGTFFTLGWIAKENPTVVREIVARGHELASHGYWHQPITAMTPESFRQDVRDAKAILEDVSGVRILGYRAPLFSVLPETEWALAILVEEGYAYDSSIFPGRRPDAGGMNRPRFPWTIDTPSGSLLELPLASGSILGVPVPAAGGAYLRHFPARVIRNAFRSLEQAGGGGMFYIHPREIDAGQPRLFSSPLTQLRHYGGVGTALAKIKWLLRALRFTSAARLHASRLPSQSRVVPATSGTP